MQSGIDTWMKRVKDLEEVRDALEQRSCDLANDLRLAQTQVKLTARDLNRIESALEEEQSARFRVERATVRAEREAAKAQKEAAKALKAKGREVQELTAAKKQNDAMAQELRSQIEAVEAARVASDKALGLAEKGRADAEEAKEQSASEATQRMEALSAEMARALKEKEEEAAAAAVESWRQAKTQSTNEVRTLRGEVEELEGEIAEMEKELEEVKQAKAAASKTTSDARDDIARARKTVSAQAKASAAAMQTAERAWARFDSQLEAMRAEATAGLAASKALASSESRVAVCDSKLSDERRLLAELRAEGDATGPLGFFKNQQVGTTDVVPHLLPWSLYLHGSRALRSSRLPPRA